MSCRLTCTCHHNRNEHTSHTLPLLLGIAWLLPLASFTLIVFFGPRMGQRTATDAGISWPCGAIIVGVRAVADRAVRLGCATHPLVAGHHARHEPAAKHAAEHASPSHRRDAVAEHARRTTHARMTARHEPAGPYITGDWYTLGAVRQAEAHDRLLHRRADRRRCSAW